MADDDHMMTSDSGPAQVPAIDCECKDEALGVLSKKLKCIKAIRLTRIWKDASESVCLPRSLFVSSDVVFTRKVNLPVLASRDRHSSSARSVEVR